MRKQLWGILVGIIVVAAATGTVLSVNEALVEDDGGYIIYINPATGNPGAEAPGMVPVLLDKQTREALNTSWDGLKQVPAPGGGVMVNLQGRFQHGYVAVTDGQGNVKASCLSGIPQKADGEHLHLKTKGVSDETEISR